MRVAILKKDYSDIGGGAERYARELCSGLTRRGCEIFVFSQTFNAEKKNGIHHIRVPKNKINIGFSPTCDFHRKIQKIIDKKSYDIVYAVSRTYPSDCYRVTESLHQIWIKIRYPSYQRFNPRHVGILNIEKQIFKEENTGIVICNSELTKKQVVENYNFPEDKIKIVRNGVNHGEFKTPSAGEKSSFRKKIDVGHEKLVLFFAASNFKIKGLINALNTIALLPASLKKQIVFLIAGNDNIAKYEKYAASMSLSENVRFIGKIQNMKDYYAASDIFFYPALYEPFANVCLEAMACGTPVLTNAMNGASELINNNSNGWVVPSPYEENTMASIIANFAETPPAQRAKIANNAVSTSLNFSWEKHCDEILNVFIKYKEIKDKK